MKLTKTAYLALKGLDNEAKARIAVKAEVSTATVYRWILDEHRNLTLPVVLKAISEEIGLSVDHLMEQEQVNEATK